jgi:PKD repeat protein
MLLMLLPVICWGMAGSAGADLPLPGEWTEQGTVISKGSSGSWDDTDVRMGCVIVFRDSLFLYYVGADHQRPDGDAGNMAIGLAKSADGINFTKYSGNPVITFRPTDDAEECPEFPQAAVLDDGTIRMYWGGNTSIGGGLVRCDIYLSTSTDGIHWSSGTKVIDYQQIGSGGGDEIWPIGLLHAPGGTATGTGNWHLWLCGDRTPTGYSAKLAVSDDGISWQEQNESPVLTDYLWQEGLCPVLHDDGSVTVLDFCGCETGAGREIRFRTTHRNSLHSYSGVIGSFNDDPWWPGTVGVVADTSAGLWRLFWPDRSGDIGGVINMKTAPMGSGPQNQAPQASFTADPSGGRAPLEVDLDASASWDPDGDDLSYDWTIRRGTSTVATGQGVTWSYIFQDVDLYDAVLAVTDDGQPVLSDTATAQIEVVDQLPPTAAFSADPMSGTFEFPLEVAFDAAASDDPDGSIVSYDWDFGDGSDSTLAGPAVAHVYQDPGGGSIGVTLTVTDNEGAQDDVTHQLSFSEQGQELEVSQISKTNYQTAYLQEGQEYYVDRPYTVSDLPGGFQGLLWIRTANDDKNATGENFLSFTISQDATVYIGYDHRASSLPDWITANYAAVGDGVGVSDVSASPLMLWSRDVSAGTVVLGGNMAAGASGAGSMYIIMLRALGPPPDTQPPDISAVTATGISASQATIEWSTDEPSDSRVEYGLTAAYGSQTPLDGDLVTAHAVGLSGLSSGTVYHYRVRSADQAGNEAFSADDTFQTADQGDITPPLISDVQVSEVADSQATVSWTTDEPSDSQVEYGLTDAYGSATGLDTALVTGHAFQLAGLTPETIYHYRVLSADADDNMAASGDHIFETEPEPDRTSPVLSAVTVSSISDTMAVLSWTTNEPADSRVEYGLLAEMYNWTLEDTALTFEHSLDLFGLTPFTEYHFRLLGQDAAGNEGVTQDSSFTTHQELPQAPGKPEHFDD